MDTVLTTTFLLLASPPATGAETTGAASGGLVRPVFTKPESRAVKAPEGHTTLRWRYPGAKSPTGLCFELQQAPTAAFRQARTRYLGPDRAVFVSGLGEGDAFFRVRPVVADTAPGPWSRTARVQVRYVSRRLVLVLMGVGALLLLATLAVIFGGHRRSRAAEVEAPGE